MPATLSILAHVFPPNERPRAIAIWAAVAGVGVALGGVTSGWLLRHFWWGSIFLINVVVVVLALVVGAVLIPRSRERVRAPLDPVGALLSIAGLGTLVYGIIEAPDHGWGSASTITTFAVAITLILAFIRWELHATNPMLDLRYFRNPRFSAATTAITFVFFVMFGSYFVITQYLQSVHGYDPLAAGVRILPFAIAYMVSATRSARLVERFGQRRVVSFGMVVVAAGLAMMSRSGVETSYLYFAVSLATTALGMGLVTAPSTGAIMQSLPLDKAGVGSAVNDTTRELGGALGVAVFGSLVASTFHSELVSRVSGVTGAASRSLGAALQQASTLPAGRGTALAGAARESFVRGFDSTLVIAVAVSLVAAVLITWLLRPAPRMQRADETDNVSLEAA
jgi:EmrB/QacA subfamily drug resistance transporter